MSISDSFRDPSHGSEPDDTRPDAAEISEALERVAYRLQHVDPIVRSCNRRLVDMLGQCPNTESGNWVTVDDDDQVQFHVGDLADVQWLNNVLAEIESRLELGEVRAAAPVSSAQRPYAENVVNKNRTATACQSVHIVAPKGRGLYEKGA